MRCLQFLVQSLRVWLAFYETMANSHVKKMVVISEALYKTLTNMQSTSRFKSNTEFSNMQDNIEGLDRLRQEKENLLAEDDDDDDDNEEKNEEGEEFLKILEPNVNIFQIMGLKMLSPATSNSWENPRYPKGEIETRYFQTDHSCKNR